jgi:protein SCO1/2
MRNLLIPLVAAILVLAACQSTPAKRYTLTGKIDSVDKSTQTIVVNGDAVPGFMPAMSMSYKVKDPAAFNQLAAGDSITADLLKQEDDYWLENVKIAPPSPPPSKPQVK